MEILDNLFLGLQTALSLTNLAYCLLGVFLGTAIGVLPDRRSPPCGQRSKPRRDGSVNQQRLMLAKLTIEPMN
jgi:hypothetical protein